MLMDLIATFAQPSVRLLARGNARGLQTFIRLRHFPLGVKCLHFPRPPTRCSIAAPAAMAPTPIAPAAPAADITGCLMTAVLAAVTMSEPALTALLAPPVFIIESPADRAGPTPGMNPTAFFASPPRKEKKPGPPTPRPPYPQYRAP